MDLKYQIQRVIFSNRVYRWFLQPFDRLLYPVVDDDALKQRRAAGILPLNKVAQMADLSHPPWKEVLEDMAPICAMDEASFHRKIWEYVHIVYALRSGGHLHAGARGLASGAGREGLLYYLATKVGSVVGIDLYEGKYLGGEDERDIPLHPQKYAPFKYPEDHLELTRMDSRNLDYADDSFDFAFSASSIEHFGTTGDIERAVAEMFRVLKPGGACVITTELRLNRLGARIPNTRIFHLRELLDLFVRTGFLPISPTVEVELEGRAIGEWVVLPHGVYRRPHVVLRFFNTVFTSIALLLRKPGDAVTRGRWPQTSPPAALLYRGAIEVELDKRRFRRREHARCRLRIKNTSNFAWFTDGYSHRIAVGVQLLSREGRVLEQNHADLAIPRDLPVGDELTFEGDVPLPRKRGRYTLLFDLKRELVCWFESQGNPAVRVDIEVG